MGAWGCGIRQDDSVCDVIGCFEDQLKQGKTLAAATQAVMRDLHEYRDDLDDGPLFWIALAEMQWTYGRLDPKVLAQVKKHLPSDLERWEGKDQAKRRALLDQFVQKIEIANPRPKKPPRIVVRKPIFAAGDCLALRLSNGQYGAALVLVADHSHIEYGKNLIGLLDYCSKRMPSLPVFKQRRWLRLTHHNLARREINWYSGGFRRAKGRFELIGNIFIRKSDPRESNSFAGWDFLGEQVLLQRKWDRRKS